jgi:hypothetical protein
MYRILALSLLLLPGLVNAGPYWHSTGIGVSWSDHSIEPADRSPAIAAELSQQLRHGPLAWHFRAGLGQESSNSRQLPYLHHHYGAYWGPVLDIDKIKFYTLLGWGNARVDTYLSSDRRQHDERDGWSWGFTFEHRLYHAWAMQIEYLSLINQSELDIENLSLRVIRTY